MTELDHASLDRVLPSTPGSSDWDDVMSRFRARQGRRRRRMIVLAAAALVTVGTASAFGMRGFFLDRGFIGLPPEGATPSTLESAKLEIFYWVSSPQLRRAPSGPWDGNLGRSRAWVYADGRLLWLREADLPEGANPWSTGFLEQRLTPKGVELLRSEIVSTGEFGDDQPPRGSERLPFYTTIQVRNGERLVPVTWASDLARLEARLSDPESWLPASAWKDRKIRAYVPSRYKVWYSAQSQTMEPSRILALLPAPVEKMLRAKRRTRTRGAVGTPGHLRAVYNYSSDVTTEEARALAAAFDNAGVERFEPARLLGYRLEARGRSGNTVFITFEPYLPHGEATCSACG
jgi:hypothetical protein